MGAKYDTSNYASVLFLQKPDQSVVPARESDFFNYTAKRFLFNEAYELSRRRVHFNIQGLFETVLDLIGNGATRCVHAMKYREGQYNKVFRLELDNGAQVVAKIPNPNAGPGYYTTASEVATMDYLRNVLKVPVPKILAWNPRSTNNVGSEYIIMEIAKGSLLSEVWYQLKREAKNKIVQQLVDLEALLTSRPFTSQGSLFYKEDISRDLLYRSESSGDSLDKFSIGPSIHSALWEDGRDKANVYKGPWSSIGNYASDIGKNELDWTLKYAKPRMNYFRYDDKPEHPREVADLLETYLAVAPLVTACTNDLEYLATSVLSHPDLHLSNLFIDPETSIITGVIDWQGTTVSPIALQAKIPRMVRHAEPLEPGLVLPERISNYENLDAEARQAADAMYESALCQKYYEVRTAKCNPQLYSAIIHNTTRRTPFLEPLQVVLGSWKNREVYKLRSSLIRIVESWNELGSSMPPCPIGFDEEEVDRHDKELENIDYVQTLMEAFQEEGILPADGRVNPEDFQTLKEINAIQKERYLSMANDESDRLIMEQTWPWQDWPERAV